MSEAPELTPCLLMVDGNGILHPNRAGVASHIGTDEFALQIYVHKQCL